MSDLSAIHRIDDPGSQPAVRILRLAYRIAHYPGTLRNLALAEHRTGKSTRSAARTTPADEDTTWIDSTPAAIAHSPLARYISFGGDHQDV